jgi:uncharacterized protein
MARLVFVWDDAKDLANRRKHGVSFDEASTVFSDDEALFMADPEHSEDEDRFVLLGLSNTLRILLVCHCYRASESAIRIISAWKADKRERAQYVARRNR